VKKPKHSELVAGVGQRYGGGSLTEAVG